MLLVIDVCRLLVVGDPIDEGTDIAGADNVLDRFAQNGINFSTNASYAKLGFAPGDRVPVRGHTACHHLVVAPGHRVPSVGVLQNSPRPVNPPFRRADDRVHGTGPHQRLHALPDVWIGTSRPHK